VVWGQNLSQKRLYVQGHSNFPPFAAVTLNWLCQICLLPLKTNNKSFIQRKKYCSPEVQQKFPTETGPTVAWTIWCRKLTYLDRLIDVLDLATFVMYEMRRPLNKLPNWLRGRRTNCIITINWGRFHLRVYWGRSSVYQLTNCHCISWLKLILIIMSLAYNNCGCVCIKMVYTFIYLRFTC